MKAEQAELATLGCMLMFPDKTAEVFTRLSPKMFSSQSAAVLFNCMMKMHRRGIAVDAVTVVSKLGEDYKPLIATAAETAVSVSHFDEYVAAVLDAWRNREIVSTCTEISTNDFGTAELLQKLGDLMAHQTNIQNTITEATNKDFTASSAAFMVELYKADTSIKTGWHDFDTVVGGLQRAGVYVIAARPGKGKTDFAVQMATQISKGCRVLYNSLEMTTNQLMQRVTARACRINSTDLRDHKVTEAETKKIGEAMAAMSAVCKIRFDEAEQVNVEEIENRVVKYQPDVVFIDHLGLMKKADKRNQWEAVAEVTHQLKALAKRRNIAVVELVQLNRRTDGQSPTMGDLYGGAAVEQDADAVFALTVEPIETFLTGDEAVGVKVEILKNRFGGVGTLKYRWQPQYHSYYEEAKM